MRTAIFGALIAATLMPATAMARDNDVRDARRDVQEERREYRQALRTGDRGDIREERRELERAKREYREEKREAWRDRSGHHWSGRGVAIGRPHLYRLPPAPVSARWIRHRDDALLVDLRSNRVIRVRYDYFG